jgi:probable HAF family extracellular repeat protein
LSPARTEDINDLKVIVGASASGLGGTEEITCVCCTPPAVSGGSATFLGLRNGFGGPCSINIHGDVLGRDLGGTVLFREATQQVFCIPELNGYQLTPAALDDNLQVAGFGGAPTKAWRYDPLTNKFTVLNKRSVATGMNDSGDVGGYGYFKPTDQHAFWWYFENGVERVIDVGTLGGKWSRAESINNSTDRTRLKIVGTAANKNGQSRPFIYTPATGMVDLGLCIVGEEIAPGVIVPVDPAWGVTPIIVNNNGQIAAFMAGGIPWQAARLDPVAE